MKQMIMGLVGHTSAVSVRDREEISLSELINRGLAGQGDFKMSSEEYSYCLKSNLIDFLHDEIGVVRKPTLVGRTVIVEDNFVYKEMEPSCCHCGSSDSFRNGKNCRNCGSPQVEKKVG